MASGLSLISNSPEETQEIGRLLGQSAKGGDVLLLTGPLGAGKTCLTQGIAWGLGVEGYARSPTFVIAARYLGRLTLHHIDLFRVQDGPEALDIGMEEYLSGEDICVVEWAERAAEIFPRRSLWITLEYGKSETDRLITLEAEDHDSQHLLEGFIKAGHKPKDGE